MKIALSNVMKNTCKWERSVVIDKNSANVEVNTVTSLKDGICHQRIDLIITDIKSK